MLLRRLKLVNYGGIYNGLGLDTIEIDFTKCQHRIVLIKGDNGSGKSTIEGALKPLPDDSSSFIAGKTARKEIEYYDEFNNVVYIITFIHEVNGSTRKTQGYITKVVNGAPVELNPTGNITSCKEYIYEELQLDPNYITLTQLSSNKRGIADLRPADRKRYVNAILTATDVYNDMYKTLSKKASTYKGMVQSITSKIDNIGNVVQLQETLKSIEERIAEGETMLERHNEIMNQEKGMLNTIDPNNKLRERVEYLTSTLKEYKVNLSVEDRELRKLYNKLGEDNVVTPDMVYDINTKINDLNSEVNTIKSKINMIMESRQSDSEELQVKTAKLQSINSSGSLSETRKLKNELTEKKRFIEDRWDNVIDLNTITSEEFASIYNIIHEMIEVAGSVNTLSPNADNEYRECVSRIKEIDDEIDRVVATDNSIVSCEEKVTILESRPSNCTNDTCPFISDALKAKDMIEKYAQLRKNYKSIMTLNKEKELCSARMEELDKEKYLIQLYNANQRVLRSLRLNMNTYESCVNILKKSTVTVLNTLNSVMEYVNDIDEYKKVSKSLDDINNRYHALSSQEDFINMITNDISNLQRQIDADVEVITKLNAQLESDNSEIERLAGKAQIYNDILTHNKSYEELNEGIYILEQEIQTNKENIDKIQKINSDIEKLTANIAQIKEKIGPLKQDKETISYNLRLTSEYNKELSEYKNKYDKIETLRYYCSPTTGIQLLFANMYLSQILDNANRILQSLFGGTFALLPLIITESEFRIPVAVNGGLNHDDITSMSSAQISLISMIISISLLSQTSSKLNIIVGDEIDAPFDSENRREFITILYQLMSLVKASQCVLISHNSEIPMNECDVILLKCENDIINEGNIIWSYK